jgi:hypothetical protein
MTVALLDQMGLDQRIEWPVCRLERLETLHHPVSQAMVRLHIVRGDLAPPSRTVQEPQGHLLTNHAPTHFRIHARAEEPPPGGRPCRISLTPPPAPRRHSTGRPSRTSSATTASRAPDSSSIRSVNKNTQRPSLGCAWHISARSSGQCDTARTRHSRDARGGAASASATSDRGCRLQNNSKSRVSACWSAKSEAAGVQPPPPSRPWNGVVACLAEGGVGRLCAVLAEEADARGHHLACAH